MRLRLKKICGSDTFQTLSIFAGGNILVSIINGLAGLLQARWVSPVVLGEFRKYGIITMYLYFGLVLVHDGLMRQYPYLIGKGDNEEALRVSAAAKWWYVLLSWIFSIFFMILVLHSLYRKDWLATVGWGAQIPMVWTVYYGAYQTVMYRTSSHFKRLAYNSLILSVLSFVCLFFVKLFGYWGLAIRLTLANISGILINQCYLPVKIKAVFDYKRLVGLAKISIPLSVPGYIQTSCLHATLSGVILKYCGETGLGLYGIAFVFQGFALTFTAALNQIFTVKLTKRLGETENVYACFRYAMIPTLLSAIAATGLAVALCITVAPFIRILIPQYVDAIPLIQIFSILLPLMALGLPLIMLRAALWYKAVIFLSLFKFSICFLLIFLFEKTLTNIVACMVIAEFSTLLAGYSIVGYRYKTKRDRTVK